MSRNQLAHYLVELACETSRFYYVDWMLGVDTRQRPLKEFNSFQIISSVGMDCRTAELLPLPEDTEPIWIACATACWHSDPKKRPTFQQLYGVCRSVAAEISEGKAALVRGRHSKVDAGMAAWRKLSPS
eukprot:COSAG02_NODE_9_length_59728_cov_36.104714_18_plen_129_part_00